jgi:sulfur relay (sulfurtransferase) DsrC/TusE family protein
MKFSKELIQEARHVKGMNIKAVVDDEEWQAVRKSLIGNWKNNHLENVATLRAYFNKYPMYPLAMRRLVNVLTGSVHRVGHTKGQSETDELRRDVRIRWRLMLDEEFDRQDYRYVTGEI